MLERALRPVFLASFRQIREKNAAARKKRATCATLLRNSRKTEPGAKQLLAGLVKRAAPFAL
jgi:hypothetical protein